jgi:hypothetical protein
MKNSESSCKSSFCVFLPAYFSNLLSHTKTIFWRRNYSKFYDRSENILEYVSEQNVTIGTDIFMVKSRNMNESVLDQLQKVL